MNERYLKDKLLGRIRYPQHVTAKQLQYIYVISVPQKRAKILNIISPHLPEGYTLIQVSDIPGKNWIDFGDGGMPLLAENEVFFPHQPIALLCGPKQDVLQKIGKSVKVVLEEGEPYPDFDIAQQNHCSYHREIRTSSQDESKTQNDVFWLEDYFELDTFSQYSYPSAHGRCQRDGLQYNIHTVCQWPWIIRKNIHQQLKIPRSNVNIKSYPCENHNDSKIFQPVQTACFTALASYILKKSSIYLLEPQDVNFSPPPRGKVGIYIKGSCNHRGELLTLKLDFSLDGGAYSFWGKERVDRMCFFSSGVYHCRNLEINGKIQTTATPPSGIHPDGDIGAIITAVELFSNLMAEKVNLTPLEWKRLNLLERGNGWFTSALLSKNPATQSLMDRVVEKSDYKRKYSSYQHQSNSRAGGNNLNNTVKGIGLSLGCISNNFIQKQKDLSPWSVDMELDQQGLTIHLPSVPGHNQLFKEWSKGASEILSLEESNINFEIFTQKESLSQGPSCFSRNVTVLNHLINQCLSQIARRRFRDPLPIKESRRYRRNRKWDDDNFKGNPFQHFSWGAAVVELELNQEENSIDIHHIYLALDSGKLLIPSLAQSVVNQAVGQTLKSVIPGISLQYTSDDENPIPYTLEFMDDSKEPKALDGLVQSILPAAVMQAIAQATGKSQHFLPVNPGNWEKH